MTERWNKRIDRYIIPLLLASVALSYHLFFFRHWLFDPLDEGYLVYGGKIVLEGKILYRDFFSMYSPGLFYLLALFYKFFGLSLVPARVMLALFLTGTSVVAWFISLYLTKSRLFSLIPSLLIIFYGGIDYLIIFSYSRTFFGLLALTPLIGLGHMGKTRLFILALLLVLSLLFSPEVGISALTAILFYIFLYQLFSSGVSSVSLTLRWKSLIQNVLYLVLSVSVLLIPIMLYFASKSALAEMLYDLFVYPVKVYKPTMGLPFPSITFGLSKGLPFYLFRGAFVFYLSIIIYLAVFMVVMSRVIQKKKFSNDTLLALSLLVYGIVLFQSALGRSDFTHLVFCLTPVYILGVCLLQDLRKWILRECRVSLIGNIATVLLFLIPLTSVLYELNAVRRANPRVGKQYLSLTRGQVFIERQWADPLNQLAEFFQKNGKEGDSIFVLPFEPLIYFLFNRENPTRHTLLFLVGEDNELQQKEIIERLERSKPGYIIYNPVAAKWLEDSVDRKRFEDYAGLVKRYIKDHYRLDEQLSPYQIWKLLPTERIFKP